MLSTLPVHLLFFISVFAVLIAEVTQTSLGVGYEIGRAVNMNKRILCLYRPQSTKRNGVAALCR